MTRWPLLALAGLSLAAGVWAGLARLGWPPGPLPVTWAPLHGPLMISGFLGILVSLERAIALLPHTRWPWAFAAPALAAAGSAALLAGLPTHVGRSLMALGSLVLLAVFVFINRRQPSWAHGIMGLGALAWLIGNALWWGQRPIFEAVAWWMAFLVFTIAGERLELARVWVRGRAAVAGFLAASAIILAGLSLATLFTSGAAGGAATLQAGRQAAVRLTGLGWLGLALWLLRFDVARRTVRQRGLTRYIAVCLLAGYAWLAVSGALWLARPERLTAGPWYDAMLHTVFVGFVLSMIFAHAPLILPAVLGRPLPYRPAFYAHLALLHVGLLLRVAGDLSNAPGLRPWGGLLNGLALLVFMANSALAVLGLPRPNRARRP